MKTETLNIAILPSDEVATQAIAMSRQISDELGSRYLLSSNTTIPHITVYQAQYPDKNVGKLKSMVKEFTLEQGLFEIKLDAITVSYGTFLFWNCEKTRALQDLHEKAVMLANPLREGFIPSQLADRTNLTFGDKYDIKTFGSLLIGSRYQPHITITRLNKETDGREAIKILTESKKLSFNPKRLILGYLGEHGIVTGVIESFSFR